MLLATDIGNTQTVMGLFDEKRLVCSFRTATNAEATSDELRISLLALLQAEGMSKDCLDALIVCSVVPQLTRWWMEAAERLSLRCMSVNTRIHTGLKMLYKNPLEIGADRIADAVAAIERLGAPVVVVDLGTATNIEVIDKSGAFVGGVISPGLATGAQALFASAARIPSIDMKAPENVIGDSTAHAVQSGIMYGEVARIDGLVEMIWDQLGYKTPVVATGGLSPQIAPRSKTITEVDTSLTLEGLRILWERNA